MEASTEEARASISTEEIHSYARWIGMDPLHEPDLLWIAEEALVLATRHLSTRQPPPPLAPQS